MAEDPAIPAATLIVVCDGEAGAAPRILIVERAEGMAFAGGALVFPGGRIDAQDHALGGGHGAGDGAARVAAIRETIEETAIPVGLDPLPSPELALRMQDEIRSETDFTTVLDRHGLTLDPGAMTPLARWVPKFHAHRRFDTLFLLARAPSGEWEPRAAPGECAGAFWMSAAEVLERDRRGEARLIFPTRRTLERLALHDSFDAMVEDARGYPIEPITPWVEEHDGDRFVTIPENIGFPITSEKLDGLWRG
jgi:8-oxo-dGTP pyrophosphatase MutT (NUDIX family)